jgi:fucose permease
VGNTRINYSAIVILNCVLFETGFIANAVGALMPDIIRDLKLSYTLAAFLPFSYFIAFGFISVPAGILSERFTPKKVVIASFFVGLAGTLTFALHPHYSVVLFSLFMIGCWLAAGQIPLYPLMRIACGGENLAFFSVLTNMMYGLGSIASPRLYSLLAQRLADPQSGESPVIDALRCMVARSFDWVSVYWIFSALIISTIFALLLVKLPRGELTEEERSGTLPIYLGLLKNPTVILFALGVFSYSSCEQGNANWMSQFLLAYHGANPQTTGAGTLSWFWTLLTAGCLAGMLLVKLFDSRRILTVASMLALVSFTCAIFGNRTMALVCFPLVGLFASVLWPLIAALALNSVERHHGAMTGILFSSAVGGAIGPVIIGKLADLVGLRLGLTFLYVPFLYIAFLGIRARPLVANATLRA